MLVSGVASLILLSALSSPSSLSDMELVQLEASPSPEDLTADVVRASVAARVNDEVIDPL
jgi:hypothetical protein